MIAMASTHVVVWPKVRVTVNDESVVLEQGEAVPEGVSRVDLENLTSFGAITGVTVAADSASALNIDAKMDAVLDWVGEDPARAAQALAAEQAKGDDARSTLVEKLEKLEKLSS